MKQEPSAARQGIPVVHGREEVKTTSPAWRDQLAELLDAPPDSPEHRIAETLSGMADDAALAHLVDIHLEDPPGTRERAIAAALTKLLLQDWVPHPAVTA